MHCAVWHNNVIVNMIHTRLMHKKIYKLYTHSIYCTQIYEKKLKTIQIAKKNRFLSVV